MNTNNHPQDSPRREFLGKVAAGAASIGLAAMTVPLNAVGNPFDESSNPADSDAWFNKLKGKHKIVFDATQPHEIMPFAWPKVFLLTNGATGTPASDCGVVVVLRHAAIPYAMDSSLWAKYNFGEVFKAMDPKTEKPSTRNPFWKPAADDFVVPGIGPVAIGINDLQAEGVMFCVCDAALTVYSGALGAKMNKDAKEIKKEWVAGVLPGIQIVPSGVWALGRAQEKGCGYIFAG